MNHRNQVVVIIFEGIQQSLLSEWMDAGYLPHFTYLKENGYMERMLCNTVPYEAAGLISAFSGLDDDFHGIMSYWKVHNPSYIPELWDSTALKELMFWNRKELEAVKFGIVNVFGTHPIYPVNGTMLSYSMHRTLRCSYPNDLLGLLNQSGIHYLQDLFSFYSKEKRNEFWAKVQQIDTVRCQALMELSRMEHNVLICNFTGVDRVSHFYTDELYNGQLPLDEKVVFQAYRHCDKMLGELLANPCFANSNFIVFSEIGFGKLEKFVSVNDYLAEQGLLAWEDGGKLKPDWRQSIAFESVQGSHGININRKEFYENGIVESQEYESVVASIIDLLKQMPNPYTDNSMFKQVHRRKDLFSSSLAPDIIVVPFDEQYLPYGDPYWAQYVNRHNQTGWHRNVSFSAGLGPHMVANKPPGPHRLTDIMPMIYQLLGIALPSAAMVEGER